MSEPSVEAFSLDDITGGLGANSTFSMRPLNIIGTTIRIEGQAITIVGDVSVEGSITATGDVIAGGVNSNHHSH